MRHIVLLFALAVVACGSESKSDSPSEADAGVGGSAGSDSGAGGSAGMDAGTGGTGGSAGAAGNAGASGSAGAAGSPGVDADGDGLDDAQELAWAKSYFPYYSVAPNDNCPRHGVLFRVSPHPDDAAKLALWYVMMFEKDCGAGGHPGDDEVFGAVVDPSVPAPGGLLALRAISHQGTLCEQTTTCGSLPNCKPCTQAQNRSVVFASVNKHGGYVNESTCDLSIVCDFGGCTLNPSPSAPPFVNAGEPGKPLVNDMTTDGFINAAQGWTEPSLMSYDPWSGQDFGTAGNVADDLVDPAFLIPLSGC